MIGVGRSESGSRSVSQLLDAVKSSLRFASIVADDQTLPQVFGTRGKSQPGRVAKKSAGSPSCAAVW